MAASREARRLIVVALLCVLGLAAWYGRTGWADSGPFVLVLFGIPVVCTTVALWVADRARHRCPAAGLIDEGRQPLLGGRCPHSLR